MAASAEPTDDIVEELFLEDLTDDQFDVNEITTTSEFPVSVIDSFLNVNVSSLKLVLDRLADRQLNCVEEEQSVAASLNRVESDKFLDFLASMSDLFEQCFNLRSSKKSKHLRTIELEKNFSDCRVKPSPASKAWEEILLEQGIHNNPASEAVFQHILQHFWSTVGSVVRKDNDETPSSVHQPGSQPDDMEFAAVTDHAGWAIKRARDIVKSSTVTHLNIKKSTVSNVTCEIDKSEALELISKLGEDQKQHDGRFSFIPSDEVSSFFVMLHNVVDSLLSKNQFVMEKSNVVTNCLQQLSTNQQLRDDWFLLVNKYSFTKPVAVYVLEKICTMFVKSKQQIVREKCALKPQKGSVALREELRTKISSSTCTTGKQSVASTSVPVNNLPELVIKLRRNFESPGNVALCLSEIFQLPSKRDILLNLSGKELTKILMAMGKPGLDGKKKTRQIDVLLSENHECIIKYPDKVATGAASEIDTYVDMYSCR